MIEKAFPRCYTVEYKNNIVAILDNSKKLSTARSLICMHLYPIIRDFHLNAFVSNEFENLFELPNHYRLNVYYQSKLLSSDHSESDIFFFEDYALQYVLDSLIDQCDPNLVYPQALRNLIAYDKENNTNYVQTLRAYIEHDCSPATTSQALFIHRSTFRYRLTKISEITAIDFSDIKLKVHLGLSFLLMDKLAELKKATATNP